MDFFGIFTKQIILFHTIFVVDRVSLDVIKGAFTVIIFVALSHFTNKTKQVFVFKISQFY